MSEPTNPEVVILNAALELPVALRAGYLEQACAGDAALRQQVEALIHAHAQAEDFLEAPPADLDFQRIPDIPLTEKPGDRIGRYKLLQQIGEGGCGVVYMAEQEEPVRRRVALKVIKLGMDTKQVIARFEAERQALALMDHPNIAKVLDAGATETGRPYFVMELVRGIKITDFCDEHKVPTRDRLKLFIQVCQAIQHAHQKGIIHRDIKPSNVLVTVNDGVPVPKVIDFGIAKATAGRLTDHTLFTAFEQFIGTPAYMSPEQAVMTSLDIDTRSDIYSLGVLLYELLTGCTPFDQKELLAAGLDEMRRTIREKEPLKPSTRLTQEIVAADVRRRTRGAAEPSASSPRQLQELIHLLRGDLDWIVMKSLEKDRARRYDTANGLAMDIQRHLSNEPVMARPPSNLYRLGKLARRNKLAFGAIAAVTTVLVLGVAVSTWQAVRATRAEREQTRLRQRAEQAGEVAKQQEQLARKSADEARQQQRLASEQQLLARRRYYAAQMNLAMQAWDAEEPARTLDLLETQRPQSDERDLRSFEWRHLWALCNARLRLTLRGHARGVTCVAFSPTAGMLASSSEDETIRLWDIATGEERLVLKPESRNSVLAVVFSPDGSTLASRNYDGSVRLWHLPTGRLGLTLRGPYGFLRALAISPDGKLLASGGVKRVKLWDLATGNEQMDLSIGEHSAMTTDFSPDGTMLASCCSWSGKDGLWVWDLTGKPVAVKAKLPGGTTVAWNFDCRTLATLANPDIQLRDSDAGNLRATLKGHSAKIKCLVYSPDGKTLASCGVDRTVRLWHLNCTDPQNVPSEIVGVHLDTASCLAFSLDGGLLASGDVDGSIKLWNLAEPLEDLQGRIVGTFRCGTNKNYSGLTSLLPLPDGTNFLAVTRDGTEERDIRLGHKRVLSPEAAGRGALSRGGELLATSLTDGAVKLWMVSSGRLLATISAHKADSLPPTLAFAPDGRTLVTGGFGDPVLKLWDVAAAPKLRWTLRTDGAGIDAVEFSPDGQRIVASLRHQRVWLIHPTTGRLERIVQTGGGEIETTAIVFSPDGKLLATAGESGRVRLWDVQTGALHAALKGHTTAVQALAFSSDGATVASGGDDHTARLWDAATGQERVTFRKFRHAVRAVAFTSDDQILLAGEHEGRVWMFRGDHHSEADTRSTALNDSVTARPDVPKK